MDVVAHTEKYSIEIVGHLFLCLKLKEQSNISIHFSKVNVKQADSKWHFKMGDSVLCAFFSSQSINVSSDRRKSDHPLTSRNRVENIIYPLLITALSNSWTLDSSPAHHRANTETNETNSHACQHSPLQSPHQLTCLEC